MDSEKNSTLGERADPSSNAPASVRTSPRLEARGRNNEPSTSTPAQNVPAAPGKSLTPEEVSRVAIEVAKNRLLSKQKQYRSGTPPSANSPISQPQAQHTALPKQIHPPPSVVEKIVPGTTSLGPAPGIAMALGQSDMPARPIPAVTIRPRPPRPVGKFYVSLAKLHMPPKPLMKAASLWQPDIYTKHSIRTLLASKNICCGGDCCMGFICTYRLSISHRNFLRHYILMVFCPYAVYLTLPCPRPYCLLM